MGRGRLELPPLAGLGPKPSAATNYATCPYPPARDRTWDRSLKRRLLYQLSYGRKLTFVLLRTLSKIVHKKKLMRSFSWHFFLRTRSPLFNKYKHHPDRDKCNDILRSDDCKRCLAERISHNGPKHIP